MLVPVARSILFWGKGILPSRVVRHSLHTTSYVASSDGRHRDRRDLIRSLPSRDEGLTGDKTIGLVLSKEKCYRIPDEKTPTDLFDGIPFNQLPILHIKVSRNNTIMTCVSPIKGDILLTRSCGTEGFKNCRKGTTVAAQTTGLAMNQRLHKANMTTIRVCINGIGPGRMAGVKGLLIGGGINIVSITDSTPYNDFPPRPRAAKSL